MKKSQQRLKTHRALMVAAIKLMSDDRSFSSISLREVTREAGVVPATFYRHFNEMDDLAVELVDYCFRPMGSLVIGVRSQRLTARQLVYQSVGTFVRFARRHRLYFIFLTKERLGGRSRVRARIRQQLDDISLISGHDLVALPEWQGIPVDIGQIVARMIIDQMTLSLDEILDLPPGPSPQEAKLIAHARRKVWILLRGGLSYKGRRQRQKAE